MWELENRVVHEILAHVPSCKRDWSDRHHHDDDDDDDGEDDDARSSSSSPDYHYHHDRGFELKD